LERLKDSRVANFFLFPNRAIRNASSPSKTTTSPNTTLDINLELITLLLPIQNSSKWITKTAPVPNSAAAASPQPQQQTQIDVNVSAN
jgi:hypothetical protein